MTVAEYGDGGAMASYDPSIDASVGLEDVDASDLQLPRLNIKHKEGVFVNTLTKEEFPAITAIFLGLVKNRVMWPDKVEDGDKPRCKSTDNHHGFPRIAGPDIPRSKQFPWATSNFEQAQARPVDIAAGSGDRVHPDGWTSNGHPVLPCNSCNMQKWGKDEDNKSVPPPCAEQHVYPILYMQDLGNDEIVWVPAIFTAQRTGIANSKKLINGFAQAKQAFFTTYVGITLRAESRAGNPYHVPEFRKMGPTDRNMWGEYANQLRSIRGYLRDAPRANDEESTVDSPNVNSAPAATTTPNPEPPATPAPAPAPTPAAAPAPAAPPPAPVTPPVAPAAPAAPAAPPAPAPAPDGEHPIEVEEAVATAAPAEDPWTGEAVATPPVAPAAPPVAPAPPTPPAAPVAAPAAPPAPAPAPPAPPAAPAAPVAAAPAPVAAPADGDDLPF